MKILIIHTFGMGDMLMFTPTLKRLIEIFPKSEIDFFITQQASAKVIEANSKVKNIFIEKNNIKNLFFRGLGLRKKKYDISIITSGVKPWKGIVFSFLVGANIKCGEISKYNFLYKYFIKKNIKQHRVIANIKLLNELNPSLENFRNLEYKYWFSNDNIKFSENFIKKNNLENKIIFGIHPGCNKNFKYRRWPKENYEEVIKELSKKINIIVFLGPDEIEEGEYLKNKLKNVENVIFLKEKDLGNVAIIISKCSYFFNSDSGLGHIAGCFDLKKTFTIFGPANPFETKVYNKNNILIYNHNKNENYYKIVEKNGILKCLNDISIEKVLKIIEKEL